MKPTSLLYNLPNQRTVDAGDNDYIHVMDAPAHTCQNLYAFCVTNGAYLSLDGGVTTHVAVPAGVVVVLSDLKIKASDEICAKNLTEDAAFALLHVSVW